ncbi:MAG: OmpA family protein [Flavobacteriales bacterium]|nr:OmpA family protein [Flavobacteriales bacterium]
MVNTFFKKSMLALSICTATANSWAQTQATAPKSDYLPAWYVGLGAFGGSQSGKIDQNNWSQFYLNALNANIANLEQSNASNAGFNASFGYFFGKKRMIGLGTGFQYLYSKYDLNLEQMGIEYQSTDAQGGTFRQVLGSNGAIVEQIKQNTMGIPLMVMFKKDLTQKWGINLDAGVVFNVSSKAKYAADNVSFDYEAIYKLDNNGATVYDNSSTPDPNSWLITQEHYNRINPNGDVNAYFDNLHNQGFNVGLGVAPTSTAGTVNNLSVSTAWFVRPSVSYKIKPNVALHLNLMLQQLKTNFDATANYRITDQMGTYNSMTGGMKSNTQLLFNAGLGVRYYFGKPKAVTPPPAPVVVAPPVEKKPEPVVVKEQPKEPVKEPVKPIEKEDPYKALVKVTVKLQDEKYGLPVAGNIAITQGTKTVFNGKADNSGISNFYLEPGNYAVEVKALGYLTADEDLQLATSEKGKSKTIELKQPKIEKGLTFKLKNISFETGSDKITQESYNSMDKMAEILKENPTMVVEVAGHTDNTGDAKKNLELSQKRANQVMTYLISKGVNAKQMKAIGYGETKPVADNETIEGKALNRRVMFTVLDF